MQRLTDHEKKILELVKKHPEILDNPAEREKIAKANSMTEKTLRNRIADLKRYGLVGDKVTTDDSQKVSPREYPSLLDYIAVILRWKRTIFLLVFFTCAVVAVYSLIMPKTYQSHATIVPSEYETSSTFLGALPTSIMGIDLGRGSAEIFLFKAIFESRTLQDATIDKFGLIDVYAVNNVDEAIEELTSRTIITITNENTLKVIYSHETSWFSWSSEREDSTKKFVAEVARFMIDKLDQLNREYQSREAKSYREFIENRYKGVKTDLAFLEDNLKEFQDQHEVIMLDEQLVANFQTAALLEAEIIKKEMELSIGEEKHGADNPLVTNLRAELQAAKSALNASFGGTEGETRYLLGYNKDLPSMLQDYLRMQRDLLIQTEIFKFLTTKFEEAKLREAEDIPTIQVLDYPHVPFLRSSPRRAMMVVTTGVLMIIFSVILVFVLDFFSRIRSEFPEQYTEIRRLSRFRKKKD